MLSNQLSHNAKDDIVLPDLKISSLISLGQLCDDDCVIILDKKVLEVRKKHKLVMKGIRNMKDRLWDIPITYSTIKENYELLSSHAALHHQNKKAHAHASPLKCRKHSKKPNHHQNKLNVIIRKKQTHKELAQCLHTT